ncbi:MAG: hypothetical protein HYT61_01595 [Candidatus Yanofskybacteria bacterium]|nr:hypothetical protein [Candidatus Yanofskybacteria bacterium]
MEFLTAEEVFDKSSAEAFKGLNDTNGVSIADIGKFLLHGTTDLAILFESGIVLATDGRAAGQDMHIGDEFFDKTCMLDSHSLIAISGVPGLGFSMAKLIRARFMFSAMDHENLPLPAETKANVVAASIRDNLGLVLTHKLVVQPILAIFDLSESKPCGKIFSIWIDGTVQKGNRYVTCGSGGQVADVVLDLALNVIKKKPDQLSLQDAQHLAVLALEYAHKRDAATGGKIFMRVITKHGVESVSEEEISGFSEKIARSEVLP